MISQGQDIDALLVSALYGELTPADEARLATHLESHPADRGALDDLKVARQAIRESRIFELQLDPPQSISALLLQEAARRAPKRVLADDTKRETWFGRFVRSFVAHPAMAAAATLVLVVGVAGTLYMRKGNDQFAEQVADQQMAKGESAPARESSAPTTTIAQGSAASVAPNNDGVAVGLRDDDGNDKQGQEGHLEAKHGAKTAGDSYRKADSAAIASNERAKIAQHTTTTPKPPEPALQKGTSRLEGRTTPDLAPKDVADPGAAAPKADPTTEAGYGNANGIVAAGPSGASGGAAATPRTHQPSPPPSVATVDRPQTSTKPTDDARKEVAGKDDATTSWARDTHQRLLGLVKSGKCQDAAPLAVQIKNKAPDYYNAYVVNDRGLKQCMQYITDAAERDAEKSQKSRPAKRNEPAAADSMK